MSLFPKHYAADTSDPESVLCGAHTTFFTGWASLVTCEDCKKHPDFPEVPINEARHIALDEIERAEQLLARASKRIEALRDDTLPEWRRTQTLNLLYSASGHCEEALGNLDDED